MDIEFDGVFIVSEVLEKYYAGVLAKRGVKNPILVCDDRVIPKIANTSAKCKAHTRGDKNYVDVDIRFFNADAGAEVIYTISVRRKVLDYVELSELLDKS